MQVINFAEQNSIINHYMAELRDKNYQKNRITFRHNVERIGEMMAFELSKTLEYKPISTSLTVLTMPLYRPIACTSTASIRRWASMRNTSPRLA